MLHGNGHGALTVMFRVMGAHAYFLGCLITPLYTSMQILTSVLCIPVHLHCKPVNCARPRGFVQVRLDLIVCWAPRRDKETRPYFEKHASCLTRSPPKNFGTSFRPRFFTYTPSLTTPRSVVVAIAHYNRSYSPGNQMDLQQLSQLFASTFSPDPNVQKMAELQIRKV